MLMHKNSLQRAAIDTLDSQIKIKLNWNARHLINKAPGKHLRDWQMTSKKTHCTYHRFQLPADEWPAFLSAKSERVTRILHTTFFSHKKLCRHSRQRVTDSSSTMRRTNLFYQTTVVKCIHLSNNSKNLWHKSTKHKHTIHSGFPSLMQHFVHMVCHEQTWSHFHDYLHIDHMI